MTFVDVSKEVNELTHDGRLAYCHDKGWKGSISDNPAGTTKDARGTAESARANFSRSGQRPPHGHVRHAQGFPSVPFTGVNSPVAGSKLTSCGT